MRKATFITTLALSLLAPVSPVLAQNPPVTPTPRGVNAVLELVAQQQDPRTPPLAYWAAVATCETAANWQDTGKYAGGLGIYTNGRFRDQDMGTWERFGGEQFASHPSKATVIEQVVVANRIAIFGWSTLVKRKDGTLYVWNRPKVGLNGWGCIRKHKYLDIRKWKAIP